MKEIFLSLIVIFLTGATCVNVRAADRGDVPVRGVKLVVTEVVDGDTIKGVIDCQKYVTIRFADIDCPEKSKKSDKLAKQIKAWGKTQEELIREGKAAKEKLEALLKINEGQLSYVDMPEKICKTGNGDRLVGMVYAGRQSVNEFMLEKGGCRPFVCADK